MSAVEPDRPRSAPEDRTVYLPVKVAYEGLADDTNGPYFKGHVHTSPAGALMTWSISEACVVDAVPLAAAVLALHEHEFVPESQHYNCDPTECDRAGEGGVVARCQTCELVHPCPTRRAVLEHLETA